MIGRTGSGKSQLATFFLSRASIEDQPWIVIDYKGDKLIQKIPYAKRIGLNDMPDKPGVYIVQPHPGQVDEVENFLWKIWERENTGLFIDEALNVPNKKAYKAILSQGRSKRIPMINVTQRPSWVPAHVFTEADYISCFKLIDKNDQQRVNQFAPLDFERYLPQYHSWYYRVEDDHRYWLQPVPDKATILDTFAHRLMPKRRWI